MNQIVRCLVAGVPAVIGLSGPGCAGAASRVDPLLLRDFRDWRRQREQSLRSPDGYLALAGLYWLQEGHHTFGSSPDNDIVFPAGRAPEHAGTLAVKGGQVTVHSAPDVSLTIGGEEVPTIRMISDATGRDPTKVGLGPVTFWIIERSGRLAVRLRDPNNPILRRYTATPCFPYRPRWRLQARFEPFEMPKVIEVPSILGTASPAECTGRLVFNVDGQVHTLLPTGQSETDYFVVFGDRTNGRESYGGGRFLRVPIPQNGRQTIIDFNRAYNPPCAYNPHTTCPLPPPQNKLPWRIEAGERKVASMSADR